jgi:hypothetical protein
MIETTTGTAVEHRIVSALRVGAPAVIVIAYMWRIFGGVDPTDRFGDDFFYYVVPAGNWVDGAGSTFFPGEPTNGYHPLWFLWIALLHRLAGNGAIFFGLVDLTLMVLLVGFFFLFERFLRRVTGERLAAVVGAAVAAITLSVIAMPGVETALAAFVAALLLDYLSRKPLVDQSMRDAAVVGLLGAFVVLSRLDAAMLVLGLAVAVFPRWDWRRLVAVAIGAAPVYLYLAFNLVVFGRLSTTSMAAKSLDFYWPPNWWFMWHPSPVVAPVVVIAVVLTAVAIAVMVRRSENADTRRIALALAAAPLLQLVAQAVMSGWALFPWYFYFFLMALGLAAALLFAQLRRRNALRFVGIPLGAIMLVTLPLGLVAGLTPDKWQVEIAVIAQRLQAFSIDHPGVYAMGDAAGTPGWMVKRPIVHLEGLMMSHDFLDRIRRRQPLEQVFRAYHVNYYVAVRADGEDENGCPRFAEPDPEQASARAPHMAMTICNRPIEVIRAGTRYPDVRIYRIDPATGEAI